MVGTMVPPLLVALGARCRHCRIILRVCAARGGPVRSVRLRAVLAALHSGCVLVVTAEVKEEAASSDSGERRASGVGSASTCLLAARCKSRRGEVSLGFF
jgi:hypothetical protein